MSTLAEIESALETLSAGEQRKLFELLATKLKASGGGGEIFPDLKALLLEMPDVGDDADFARLPERPRDVDFS